MVGRAASLSFVWVAVALLASACVSNNGSGGIAGPDVKAPNAVFKSDAATVPSETVEEDNGGPVTTKADIGGDDTAIADTPLEDLPVAEIAAPDVAKDTADAKADTKTDAKTDTKDVPPAPVCGDSTCDGGETCTDCPQDCGACGPECGDGSCDTGETCDTCPKDCPCAAKCGDKTCDKATENCQTCPDDCGNCPIQCGNGTCEAGETCASCPKDCSCTPKCGDKSCDKATESCTTCPADCGTCPGQCNPITNLGCPANQQCYPTVTPPPVCSAPGSVQKGKICNALADCVLGSLCISGVCSGVCDTTGTTAGYTCANGGVCTPLESNGVPLGGNIGVCIGGATCNLVTNVGCGTGLSCITFGPGKACIKAGVLSTGGVCKSTDDCQATHVCVTDASNKKTCALKCNTATSLPKCTVGSCLPLSTGQPPKTAPDNLGGCLL